MYDELHYELQQMGPPSAYLWRDQREIDPADQFDPIITRAIAESSILLVVLSRNWMDRPWCRRELDMFAERWRAEGEDGIKGRIVVVSKSFIDRSDYPALLKGQQGYQFFELDDGEGPGRERDFYYRGMPVDERYEELIRELGRRLWREAERLRRSEAVVTPSDQSSDTSSGEHPRRTVFVAKPAGDMVKEYCRLVEELRRRNYDVVPTAEIPHDGSARDFVRHEISQAELSIHLLGEKSGYKPEDEERPIVELQLDEAAARLANDSDAAVETQSVVKFCRIIWAPKVLEDRFGSAPVENRNPFDVLKKFGGSQHPTDKVEGGTLSKFIDFLLEHLQRTAPPMKVVRDMKPGARIYLNYFRDDTEYVIRLGELIKRRYSQIKLVGRVFEGTPDELTAHHRKMLAECDAVVLFWAAAKEVWVAAQSEELGNWQTFGRVGPFAYRALIAGPPPGDRKKFFIRLLPENEIDVVLDLQAVDELSPSLFDPIAPSAPAGPS